MPLFSLDLSFLAADTLHPDLPAPMPDVSAAAASLPALPARGPFLELTGFSSPARREMYVFAEMEDFGPLEASMRSWIGTETENPAPLWRRRSGRAVVRHLFRLAAGLDTRGRAETVQLRDIFEEVAGEEKAKPVLAALFRAALRVAEGAESLARAGSKEPFESPKENGEARQVPSALAPASRGKGDCLPPSSCLERDELALASLRASLSAPSLAPSLDVLVEGETEKFMDYLERGEIPSLRLALGRRAEDLRSRAVAKVLRSLSHLPPGDRAVVEELSHRLVDEFLRGALLRLGEDETRAGAHAAILRDIFDLPREDKA